MAIDTERPGLASRTVDDAFIRRAVDQAHLNALRVALFQQTGDPEIAAMAVETFAPPGTPFLTHVVAREHHEALKAKAVAFLRDHRDGGDVPKPSRARTLELMACATLLN